MSYVVLEATYGSSMGLVTAGIDRQGILAAIKVIANLSQRPIVVKLAIKPTQKTYQIAIGVAHVPWLARLMSWPVLSTYFQKPIFDQQGQPKGLSAAGIASSNVIHAFKMSR